VTIDPATPTLNTTPQPAAITLGTTSQTLNDTAVLAGGFNPTGTITFTLFYNGGTTPVDTETVTVNGDGAYTTPVGFTLPTTGTVTGTYQWDASYSGDSNNTAVSDNNDPTERVTVSAASPALTTAPTPTAVTLSTTSATLNDTATLLGGYHPTGSITFTLFYNGGTTPVDTETVAVNGNGIYTTPTGFTLPTTGTVTGTYQWNATYTGDGNNNATSDNGATNEQVTVSAASPTLTTAPNPIIVTLDTTAVTLKDTATLLGGYHPTGSITFTLFYNGGTTPVDTETVTVNANGNYTTPTGFTLPTTGPVTGTYQWDATYSGDSNNTTVSETGATAEQVTVSAATPTLTTTPNPAAVTLGTTPVTLKDTADIEGGYHPTGTITFKLFHGGMVVDTETAAVNGNGSYSTPTGFTLPASGTVTGTYLWAVSYGGDPNNNSVPIAHDEEVTVSPASPTLTTTPSPTSVTLGTTSVTLTDTADLEDGFNPGGTITFTLFYNGGSTPVDTETVAVSGNGTYTTPTGFTLPTAGTVTGTYQWGATYNGDGNNNPVSDNNAASEQVTVSAASPTLTTTPNPTTIMLGTAVPPVLTDSATLAGGFSPSGTITFTLVHNGFANPVDTETVVVNGDGTYTTPTGFALPTTGVATGTYQWNASYSGDGNNSGVSDNNAADERVTVTAAQPTIDTTPNLTTVTLSSAPVTLKDTADLEGGYHPLGTITFSLFHNGGATPVRVETVIVNGNGTYTTPTGFTLPGTGTVTGTYQWNAKYSGEANNSSASDVNNTDEQVTVSAASPTLSTTPDPTSVTLGATPVTLKDAADLEGGFNPTGTITFTLFYNGGTTPVDTETVSVNGNGSYTTPGFTLPSSGTVTGTYQWDATYSGDTNNNSASDNSLVNERVTVSAASPTLTNTANPRMVTLGPATVVLKDTADLEGGFNPTGTITFTLFYNGGTTPVHTETVSVNPNGTYTTPTGYTLPSTGTVVGTYQWNVAYSGDTNNNAVSSNNSVTGQVIVSAASPALSTVAQPAEGKLGVTLQDTADLMGSYHGTGSITFRLYAPGVTPGTGTAAYTEIVSTVNGDAIYHTTTGFVSNATGTWHWLATYTGDPNNHGAGSGLLAEPVTIGAQSDLMMTIVANPTQVILGQNVTYTLTVHNQGPDPATNVVVTDQFPSGVALVGPNSLSQGVFNPATGVWSIGVLPAGASAVLTLVGQVNVLGPITYTATVQADEPDPNPSDNTSSVVVFGMRPASLVSKFFFLDSTGAATDPPNAAFTVAAPPAVNSPAIHLADAVFAARPLTGLVGRTANAGLPGASPSASTNGSRAPAALGLSSGSILGGGDALTNSLLYPVGQPTTSDAMDDSGSALANGDAFQLTEAPFVGSISSRDDPVNGNDANAMFGSDPLLWWGAS
jgi:hypothetical protein